jgi:hypothetical protein
MQQVQAQAQASMTPGASAYAARPTCATTAQKQQASLDCRNQIKGIGALGLGIYSSGPFSGMDPCSVSNLPTCITMTKFGIICPQGQAVDPSTGKCAAPRGTVMAVVQGEAPPPPSPTCDPGSHLDLNTNLCVPDTSTSTPTKTYLMWGGLILLLVAGGGYVAYKATR